MSSAGGSSGESPTVIRTDHGSVSSSPDLTVGQIIGPYQLIEHIGAGGMATVWKAKDDFSTVALKILPTDLAANADLKTRFRLEAQAAAALDHPSIAKMVNFGESAGRSFIAFEYVPGETLRQKFERDGPIESLAALDYLKDCVDGLDHAATRGVVHRDVKPANIIITPDGRAKIIDMGLARQANAYLSDGRVTTSGTTLGTFDYLSPEQAIDPRRADFRSDLYSLGCTFYHALTGTPPAPDGTVARKLQFHQNEPPIDPRKLNPKLNTDLAHVILKLLNKNPDERYQTADALRTDLKVVRESITDPSGKSRLRIPTVSADSARFRRRMAAAGVAAAGLLLMAIFGGPTAFRAVKHWWNPPTISEGDGNKNTISDGFVSPTTSEEFAEFLRDGQKAIRLLPGRDYDLTTVEPIVCQQTKLVIESTPSGAPARIILPAEETALTLRGSSNVEIRNVVFRTVSVPSDQPSSRPCGIRVEKVGSIIWVGCRFEAADELRIGSTASLDITNSDVQLRNSVFTTGAVGVRFEGQCGAIVQETGFGPHDAAVELKAGQGKISFDHCSWILRPDGGHAIDISPDAKFDLRSTASVYAAGGPATGKNHCAVLRLSSLKPLSWTAPVDAINSYFQTDFAHAEDKIIPVERRKELGWNDTRSAILTVSPWEANEPITLLDDQADPWKAFRLRLDLPGVRMPRDVVVGLRHRSPDGLSRIYAGDWPPPRAPEFTDDPMKTWWPSAPSGIGLPRNTSRQLEDLIAIAKPGDTIEIKHDGSLTMPHVTWSQPGNPLTIRPAVNSRPILLPDVSNRSQELTLINVTDGTVVLEKLEFALDGQGQEGKTVSVVRQANGTNVAFKACVATLDEVDGKTSLIRLANGELEQKQNANKAMPRSRIEECLIRGRGRAIGLQGTRPFLAEIHNSVIALDGSCVHVESVGRANEPAARGQLKLSRSSFAMHGPLLFLKSGQESQTSVPVAVEANSCLFAQVTRDKAFISIVGGNPTAPLESYLQWTTDKPNRYVNYGRMAAMVEYPREDITAADRPPSLDRDAWFGQVTKESTQSTSRIRLNRPPATADALIELIASDMTIINAPAEAGMESIGADCEQLPKPLR